MTNNTRRRLRQIRGDKGGRFLVIRDAQGRVRHRVEVSGCSWCAAYDGRGICSACGDKADRARAGIAQSDARRGA